MLSPVDDYLYSAKNKQDGNEGGSESFDTNIHISKNCGIQPNMLKNKIQLRVSCVLKQSPRGVLQQSYSKIFRKIHRKSHILESLC